LDGSATRVRIIELSESTAYAVLFLFGAKSKIEEIDWITHRR
jgi:hypothetical protein